MHTRFPLLELTKSLKDHIFHVWWMTNKLITVPEFVIQSWSCSWVWVVLLSVIFEALLPALLLFCFALLHTVPVCYYRGTIHQSILNKYGFLRYVLLSAAIYNSLMFSFATLPLLNEGLVTFPSFIFVLFFLPLNIFCSQNVFPVGGLKIQNF